MSRLLIPNTCQVPNVLLDRVIPRIKSAAVRVLLVIVRQTYGFGKESDSLSYKQLAEKTGLTKRGVQKAVIELGDLLTVKSGGPSKGANEYSLNIDIGTGKLSSEPQFHSEQKRTKVVNRSSTFKTHINQNPSLLRKDVCSRQIAKQTDSRVKTLITTFCKKYQTRSGKAYAVTWGKDAKLMKGLLNSGHDGGSIEEVMDRYFSDDFAAKTGFDIGRFVSSFNRLQSAQSNVKGGHRVTPHPGKYQRFQ